MKRRVGYSGISGQGQSQSSCSLFSFLDWESGVSALVWNSAGIPAPGWLIEFAAFPVAGSGDAGLKGDPVLRDLVNAHAFATANRTVIGPIPDSGRCAGANPSGSRTGGGVGLGGRATVSSGDGGGIGLTAELPSGFDEFLHDFRIIKDENGTEIPNPKADPHGAGGHVHERLLSGSVVVDDSVALPATKQEDLRADIAEDGIPGGVSDFIPQGGFEFIGFGEGFVAHVPGIGPTLVHVSSLGRGTGAKKEEKRE